VSEFDPSQTLESSPTPLTRDFVGLCIGILSVILVILTVAVCKWSRCLCLKRNHDHDEQNEGLSSVIGPTTSTPYHNSRRHRQSQRPSSCDRVGDVYRHVNNTRNGLLSPPPPSYNGYRLNDVKAPRVTITTLPVQPSQQLVPRLSISPQVSGSSITRSSYSIK
jgi:hypothetical protein